MIQPPAGTPAAAADVLTAPIYFRLIRQSQYKETQITSANERLMSQSNRFKSQALTIDVTDTIRYDTHKP